MSDSIFIGNFSQGLTKNRLPFAIADDAFSYLQDFYVWRGRLKRKRGTTPLGRLGRKLTIVEIVAETWETVKLTLTAGAVNIVSFYSLESTASIIPGTISLTVVGGGQTYTDPAKAGVLSGSGGGSGTINYTTGAMTISGGAGSSLTGSLSYYPTLAVMGLLDYQDSTSFSPFLVAFDTKYSYRVAQTSTVPATFTGNNFYKSSGVPFVWSGQNYQLFNAVNNSSAMWVTNNKPGLHFLTGTYTSGTTTTTITFNFKSGGVNFTTLATGDRLWFNEWDAVGATLNGIVGRVTNITGAATGDYVVTFSAAQTVSSTGIVQMLTNSISGQDGIKYYDGDPTGGTGVPTTQPSTGWVNFAPPLTSATVSINNTPAAKYYLVGALSIIPFKDRLVFASPWIQSSTGASIQLTDTMLWSWNGTTYYTPTETQTVGGVLSTVSSYAPTGETAVTRGYYVDQTGLGGYLQAGISQNIQTVSSNEDVLIVGFGRGYSGRKTRFFYTGNDLSPFLFFNIDTSLPSNSPHSVINLDQGIIDVGIYGICVTDQQQSQRIDVQIPNEVFNIKYPNQGFLRVNAIRDFVKEWVYFSYPDVHVEWNFPTRTFLYNYRDQTWAILKENFTARGRFVAQSTYTWATVPYATWAEWLVPWDEETLKDTAPKIIAGTPQGFIVITGTGTAEAPQCAISALTNVVSSVITSVNHCLEAGDYIYITGCVGNTSLNATVHKVLSTTDANDFVIDNATAPTGTYLGAGQFAKLSQPLMKTKEFPIYWNNGVQTTIQMHKYLLDYTPDNQCTLNIYLSQDDTTVWNSGSIVPTTSPAPTSNSLVYSQVLYTCPELTNIGVTAANVNLQMPTSGSDALKHQIWHRYSTSLTGDTIQIGITLSDTQMKNYDDATAEITLHAMHLMFKQGPDLA